jgi:hypothetical protein
MAREVVYEAQNSGLCVELFHIIGFQQRDGLYGFFFFHGGLPIKHGHVAMISQPHFE